MDTSDDQTSGSTQSGVLEDLFSPNASSSGDIDGLRQIQLKNLISRQTVGMSQSLLNSLITLCSFIFHGGLNAEAGDLFFAAKIIVLPEKDEGIGCRSDLQVRIEASFWGIQIKTTGYWRLMRS